MSKTTRNHYLSRFYLRKWSPNNSEMIWVTTVDRGISSYLSTKSVGFEWHLYSTSNTRYSNIDQEEDLRVLETAYADGWDERFDKINDIPTRLNIARFLALQNNRSPDGKDLFRSICDAYINEFANDPPDRKVVIKARGQELAMTVKEIREHCSSDSLNVQEAFIASMRSVENLAHNLMKKKWRVYKSDKKRFLTSDRPLCLTRGNCKTNRYGYGSLGSQIIFPISPTAVLVLNDAIKDDGEIWEIKKDSFQISINEATTQNAKRHVFNFEEDLKFGAFINGIRNLPMERRAFSLRILRSST